MDKGSILAYVGAIVTIMGAISVFSIFVYTKGKPYAVNYLKRLLDANAKNAENCAQNSKAMGLIQEEIRDVRNEHQKELLKLHKENNKQTVFNGKILQEIRDIKKIADDNSNRITRLEIEKERELLQQERKELLGYKEE